MKFRHTILIIVLALLLAGCVNQAVAPGEPVKETQESTQSQPQEDDMDQLVIEDTTVGTGAEVKDGDVIRVHYVGTLTDGTEFDSSRSRNTTFEFTLGNNEVIKGWDIGIKGMKVGGIRKLTIPPQFAYGNRAVGDVIPANSTLIFDVELVAINPL
jgi:FKBP-type peptidyl-prolyl cis-trans isomerase